MRGVLLINRANVSKDQVGWILLEVCLWGHRQKALERYGLLRALKTKGTGDICVTLFSLNSRPTPTPPF